MEAAQPVASHLGGRDSTNSLTRGRAGFRLASANPVKTMDSALFSLIGLIYEAALDPRRWPAFLQSYADTVNAPSAVLLYHDVRAHRGGVSASVGINPRALQKYNEHFATIDPWINSAERRGLLRAGAVLIGEALVPRPQLVRSEYYNDFAKDYGLCRILGGVICRDGYVTSNISTQRPDSHEPFGEKERTVLRILIPHLYRAMQVHRRIGTLEFANIALLDALDRMPIGVIVTRARGTIAFANRSAQRILELRDGLTSSVDGLKAAAPAETRVLRSLVRTAATTAAGKGTDSGGAMALSRPSLRAPFSVLVTPLRAESLTGLGEQPGMAAVFVTDPELPVQADAQTVTQFWGLTPTEAAIAVMMASGQRISDISGQLAIADGTVRWHVKRVLAKTATKRQAELVRILTTSPAIVRRGPGRPVNAR